MNISPFGVSQPGSSLQRERRVSREFTDQHGRTFYAEADALSNQPIGDFVCTSHQLLWVPPMRFAKFSKDGDLHFKWDYDLMIDELAGMTAGFYEEATKFALEHNIEPVPEVGGVIERRIRSVFGYPPLSPEVPIAAQRGEPWLLGKSPVVNETLRELVQQGAANGGRDAIAAIRARVAAYTPDADVVDEAEASESSETNDDAPMTYNAFAQKGRSMGMAQADISTAWNQYKAKLAGVSSVAA